CNRDAVSAILPVMGAKRAKQQDDDAGSAPAKPHFHGHRQRLRERFAAAGPAAVSDYELLELVLYSAIPRVDIKPLAKELLEEFGSFAEVSAAPRQRLGEWMGEGAVTQLKIVEAAAQRLVRGEVKRKKTLSSWQAVLDYCRTAMAFSDKEQ